MTQEEKELLVKDLSVRLPYDLQVKTVEDDEPYTLLSAHPNKDIVLIGIDMGGVYATSKVKIDTIKPYLRPLSSMTEEERVEYLNACGNEMDNPLSSPRYGGIDYLNANHFDYHNLIEKNLAIEVTEENNPYEN
jgi:hypothetical protein